SCWPRNWSDWSVTTGAGGARASKRWRRSNADSALAEKASTGTRCMNASFVDTNILIYAHDVDAGDRHWRARKLIADLWESGSGMLSTQVLNEFYVNVTRKIPTPLDPATARSLIEPYLSWQVCTPGPESVLIASEIAQRHRISYWDALIIHAASSGGASVLYSEDLNAGQIIEGIRIINPLDTSRVQEAEPAGGA